MRREMGASAGLLALVAVFLHTQFGPSESTGIQAGRSENASQAEGKRKGGGGESGEPVEGPWLATQAYFLRPGSRERPQLPYNGDPVVRQLLFASGHPDTKNLLALLGMSEISSLPTMWSIVATVPDPLHTRMTLALDAQIETIERSLQSAHWEFAAQWLPWSDHFDSAEGDIDERRRQRWLQQQEEELPGILIFRAQSQKDRLPADKLLFVFLVPETATAGIGGPPFFAAMHLANVLTTGDERVGLLAPTFSGSFSSLTDLVKTWRREAPHGREFAQIVYSGDVSNSDYADAFAQSTGLRFHGGASNARDYQNAVCGVLDSHGIKHKDAALLTEDESGYSSAVTASEEFKGCSLRTYVFSRDISHLRNAYQEATGAASADPYTNQSPSIGFSIKDPNSGEDSIPIFSNVQTPLTQDAIVDAITRDLNRRNTKVVVIAAGNILDTLFLMRAIRRESPNTRVFVESPNVLLVPAASRDALTGAILFSTYPMFPEGEDWLDTPEVNREKVSFFGDPDMQGLFNVSQFLLQDIGAIPLDPHWEPNLRAYRGFQGGQHYPGIWALTLNRYGFQPLDLDQSPASRLTCGTPGDCGWFRAGPASDLPALPRKITPLRSWRITVFGLGASILIGCFLVLRCNLSPSPTKPVWFVLTGALGPRFPALLGMCLSLTAFEWILISPALSPVASLFRPADGIWLFGSAVSIAGLAAPALTFLCILSLWYWRYGRSAVSRGPLGFGLRGAIYSAIIVGFFAFAVVQWFRFCYGPTEAAFFFRFRAMDLYSDSSPAAPLALLTLVCFCTSILYFKRYTLAGPGRPRLEFSTVDDDKPRAVAFQKKLQAAHESCYQQILAPSTLGGWPFWGRAAAGFLFALFSWMVLGKSLEAFELPPFNRVLLVESSLILFWLAIGCYDLSQLWKHMKRILDLIELLPLQPAFERIAQEWPRRPIWAFRKSVSRERLTRQMLYALHGRGVALQTVAAAATATPPQSAAQDLEDFLKVAEPDEGSAAKPPDLPDVARGKALPGAHFRLDEKEKYETESARIADRILRQDLRPSWRLAGPDELLRRSVDGAETPEQRYHRFCADFVALQFCRFITYAVEHLRRIAMCVSLSFLLLIVFFNSYSPQGPQVIARFLAGLFLAIGCVIVTVFAGMERNPTLSRIARSKPGELNREFWFQLIGLGGLPLLGVVTHLFPTVSQFLFQWVAPGVQAMH